jgi:hypothetical protein
VRIDTHDNCGWSKDINANEDSTVDKKPLKQLELPCLWLDSLALALELIWVQFFNRYQYN